MRPYVEPDREDVHSEKDIAYCPAAPGQQTKHGPPHHSRAVSVHKYTMSTVEYRLNTEHAPAENGDYKLDT